MLLTFLFCCFSDVPVLDFRWRESKKACMFMWKNTWLCQDWWQPLKGRKRKLICCWKVQCHWCLFWQIFPAKYPWHWILTALSSWKNNCSGWKCQIFPRCFAVVLSLVMFNSFVLWVLFFCFHLASIVRNSQIKICQLVSVKGMQAEMREQGKMLESNSLENHGGWGYCWSFKSLSSVLQYVAVLKAAGSLNVKY